jgi:L-cysteine/cystine lyase
VELPATAGVTYLNTGSAGPLLARAAAAMTGQVERELAEGRAGQAGWEAFLASRAGLRSALAELVGAGADEITLTHHTTEGINIALWGLDWRPGDRILVTSLEHAAALAAVAALARRFSLQIEVVECGRGDRAAVLAALDGALRRPARLLVTSHVCWSTGAVLPLAEMVRAAHAAGTAVLADGAQAAGAVPVDVRALGADFYAFNGYKWLCGPEGTGALAVRRDWHERLAPSFGGAFGVDEATLDLRDLSSLVPAPGAARYESGSWARPNLAGLLAALRWHQERGAPVLAPPEVAAYCVTRLQALGATVHTPPGQLAGLVAFSLPGPQPRALAGELERAGVIIRYIPGPGYLRASCAFFTTTADIDVLADAITRLTGPRPPRLARHHLPLQPDKDGSPCLPPTTLDGSCGRASRPPPRS